MNVYIGIELEKYCYCFDTVAFAFNSVACHIKQSMHTDKQNTHTFENESKATNVTKKKKLFRAAHTTIIIPKTTTYMEKK